MATLILGKRAWAYAALFAGVVLLALLAVAISTSWFSHEAAAGPSLGAAAVDGKTSVGLPVSPPARSAAPTTQEALPVQSSIPAITSNVAPRSEVVTPYRTGGRRPSTLLLGSVLAGLGLLAVGAVVVFSRRRPRMARLGAALAVVALGAALATPVFAGAATLTRWTVPHTFSDNAWGLAKDASATSSPVYFAEHMLAAPGSDPGRIAQLNPITNDLVEWPTANAVGTSMAMVGGNVFFTEPAADMLGTLEPAANKFTRWQLPTAGGDALLFWVDGSDNVWYFSQSAAKIGRLNPATNDFTEWALAPAGTPLRFFGRDAATGYMWFSLTDDAKVGRLDPVSNDITQWTLPTERPSVLAVSGDTVWFSGAKDVYPSGYTTYYTIHIGRLNVSSNEVTRWTVLPTDTPGNYAWEIGSTEDFYGYVPYEIPVATGLYRPRAVVDSSGKPWFILSANTGNWLVRLDPDKNQLLEFTSYGLLLLDIDAGDRILALRRVLDGSESVVYFDTTTNSETVFAIPFLGNITQGFLRLSNTDFWFTRAAGGGSASAKVEHLLVVP
ncbi:MAG: hypothetical protein HY681_08500 [Chloroflexi bacterium]|nr:hypothetical protein [Chloroflexota bacterium]